MAEPLSRENLLHVLKPDTEFLLNRHLATSEEWFPHEYVPYGRGRDFDPDHVWTEEDSDVRITDKAVRSALLVNLLTEDNLPYYFRTVEDMFGPEDAWGTWARRWTAEEGRHAMAIYGYLMVTQAIDPSVLERARMAQVSKGQTPSPHMMPDGSVSIQDGFIYLALQELATRISHRNTGLAIPDPKGVEVMKRVAGDENLHQLYLFYVG